MQFGQELDANIERNVGLYLIEKADNVLDWDTYESRDGNIHVSFEKGRIVSIQCYHEFFYRGINILGMTREFAEDYIKGTWEVKHHHDSNLQVNNEQMDITFWVEGGVVTSITVWNDELP